MTDTATRHRVADKGPDRIPAVGALVRHFPDFPDAMDPPHRVDEG